MEVETCRTGLLIAIHQGWVEIEIESACAILVNAMNGPSLDLSEFGRVIDD